METGMNGRPKRNGNGKDPSDWTRPDFVDS